MCKKISLTRGMFALVDDDDYEYLSKFKWRVQKQKNSCYASKYNPDGSETRMHREIVGAREGYDVDHIDGNGLNNQKENLREVTRRQNNQNLHVATSSVFPGVSRHKRSGKWQSTVKVNGKQKWLGQYDSEKEAFSAYCEFVNDVLGEEVLFDPSIPKTKVKHNVIDVHPSPKTSKYPGVHWKKSRKKWCAQIRVKRKCVCLGYYENELDAFSAYQRAKIG